MAFDLTTWKKQAGLRFKKMAGDVRKPASDTLYYTLCATALLPLAEAAAKGDDPKILIPAALGIAASVGTNLLANVVQNMKDASPQAQAEFVAQAIEDPENGSDALRAAEDILIKLDAIAQTQNALSEENKAWFAAEMQRELDNIKNSISYSASVGNGATAFIAQGDGTIAVGPGGVVVKKDNSGNIYTGPVTNNFLPKDDEYKKQHLRSYLRHWFSQSWANVSLADFGGEDQSISLLDVYVPLPVDCTLMLKSEKLKIVDWWRKAEDSRNPSQSKETRMDLPIKEIHQRDWPDLKIGESEMQKIVNFWEDKYAKRMRTEAKTDDAIKEAEGEREYSLLMEAHDAASVQERFVLVGEPGSGKSSFLHHLCLCMAGENLRQMQDLGVPDNAGLPALREWLLGLYIPIFIELHDLVRRYFSALPPVEQHAPNLPTLETFWKYVEEVILGATHKEFSQELKQYLEDGKAIILLDGLDEIPDAESANRRKQMKAFVHALEQYKNTRVIITSRPNSYKRGDWELPRYGRAELLPLSESRLKELAVALFKALNRSEPELNNFIGELKGVQEDLRNNPLFFTLLAGIWLKSSGEQRLPETKAALYRLSVDMMLEKWTARRGGQLSIAESVGMSADQMRVMLQMLACEVQGRENSGENAIVFEQKDLLNCVYEIDPNLAPGKVVEFLEKKAGVLVSPEPRKFRFAHLSFQEYLAACELIYPSQTVRNPPIEPDKFFPLGLTSRILEQPARWVNTAHLVAILLEESKRRDELWRLVVDVLKQASKSDAKNAYSAGALMLKIAEDEKKDLKFKLFDNAEDERPGKDVKAAREAAQRWLQSKQFVPAQERAAAGRALARLGDEREEATTIQHMRFCFVPAGPFDMGSNDNDDMAYDDEKPLRENVEVPAYWISQHPISNAQYAQFVNAGGYNKLEYWAEAEALGYWRWKEGKENGEGEAAHGLYKLSQEENNVERYEIRWLSGPVEYGDPYGLPNHPVVGITWFEALAFTRWLNEAQSLKTRGFVAGLPTEAEWEKAARGGHALIKSPKVEGIDKISPQTGSDPEMINSSARNRRIYPWGDNKPDDTHANYEGAGINSTSALGCFPMGASPYGCMDMSGNVWEWCFTRWQKDYKNYRDDDDYSKEVSKDDTRVIRGGSCFNLDRYVRCAFRLGVGYDSYGVGFRVVVRSHLPLRSEPSAL